MMGYIRLYDKRRCKGCGELVDADDVECPYCGREMELSL